MSMSLNERNPNTDTLAAGSLAAGNVLVMPAKYFRKHSRIKNVWLVDSAGIPVHASNHVKVTLQDNAGTPVVYASVDTAAVPAVAGVPLPLVLSENDSDSAATISMERDVPAGTMLNLKAETLGTAALTVAAVMIEWYPL